MKVVKIIWRIFIILLLISCNKTVETEEAFDEITDETNGEIIDETADVKTKTDITEVSLPPPPSTLSIIDDPDAQEYIVLAFAKAYPGKISDVEFLNDDWTFLINGARFYYAKKRFLPESLRDKWENYAPYDFYKYPWVGSERERRIAIAQPASASGSSYLFDALYASPNEDDSWDMQVKYSFLGVKMLIHSDIKPILDKIKDLVSAAILEDASISEWLAELQTSPPTSGWNWRNIAGSSMRSNHSYGMAIDFLPVDLKGRITYWRWNSGGGNQPFYRPPEVVIKIFEEYGFLWGGNWDMFDTMHFEYRPEILLLNGFSINIVN
nr:hypothetical protein [uncultured bacterium]